ncbi:hypothetical protein FGIG_11899 [Fasciola gigantica]|uniref:Uncharacterized protein n=1 Tax=Fasciola gigantica TaxID=46835 RepID=A0A504YR16_FASGI|nr:hypothetical protein FGIG_11899 [Fasciola gigantica]
MLTSRLDELVTSSTPTGAASDKLIGDAENFIDDPQTCATFKVCFKRYEDMFTVDLFFKDDETNVRFQLRKAGRAEHTPVIRTLSSLKGGGAAPSTKGSRLLGKSLVTLLLCSAPALNISDR